MLVLINSVFSDMRDNTHIGSAVGTDQDKVQDRKESHQWNVVHVHDLVQSAAFVHDSKLAFSAACKLGIS